MASRDLRVTLIGDDRTGTAFGSAGNNADGLTTKFANLGRGIALALGGAAIAGVAGVGAALVQGAKDAASYEQITNQVAQTIRSTGAAAGVSAEGLKQYAGQLESMSGVDEELILSGQNVLLTFTNVQNKVGDGNNIFDQASEAALNLSTTMGGDLVGANTLVGKALNDPIAGMTALRRAGVQLTDAQKDQVTAMVESGDVMGAQKVLLGELETQFGGAAAAAGQGLTGSLARAKDAFQDMFRGIATALLPKLAELAQFFVNTLMPGIKGIYDLVIGGDFTGALGQAFGWEEDSAVVGFLISLRENVIALWPHVQAAGAAMFDVASRVIPLLWSALQSVGSAVASVVGYFRQHETAAKALGVVVGVVAAAIAAAWVAQAAVSTANAARSVVAWLATATASTTSSTIQSKSTAQIVVGWIAASVAAAANAVKVVAGWVLMGAQAMLQGARMAAAWVLAMGPVGWVIAAVVGLVALIVANWDTVVSWTKTAWSAVTGAIGAAWEWIKGAVSAGIDFLVNLFLNFTGPGLIIKHWDSIVAFTRNAWNAVTSAVSGAWNSITSAISNGISSAVSWVSSLPGKILGALGNFGSLLWNAGKAMIQGLIDGAGSLLRNIGRFFLNLVPSWIRGPFESALGISSPSKVFAGYGQNIGQGLINGMSSMRPAIAAEMAALADSSALESLLPSGINLVRMGDVNDAMWEKLKAAGWKGRAGDNMEALYRPQVSQAAPGASGPMVHIENYNEARQSPYEVAQDLTFLARTRG